MVEIRWTLQAADDLQSIAEFIAKDSPHYARFFAAAVLEAVRRLSNFPKSGRIVPELKISFIREIILGNYRIIYQLRGQTAQILTVYHGSKLLNTSKLNS